MIVARDRAAEAIRGLIERIVLTPRREARRACGVRSCRQPLGLCLVQGNMICGQADPRGRASAPKPWVGTP